MVTSEIQGGLGNKLLIYAAAKPQTLKKDMELQSDISHYDNFPLRGLNIDNHILSKKGRVLPKYWSKFWFKTLNS